MEKISVLGNSGNIKLGDLIKTSGEYEIKVDLGMGVAAHISVRIEGRR